MQGVYVASVVDGDNNHQVVDMMEVESMPNLEVFGMMSKKNWDYAHARRFLLPKIEHGMEQVQRIAAYTVFYKINVTKSDQI